MTRHAVLPGPPRPANRLSHLHTAAAVLLAALLLLAVLLLAALPAAADTLPPARGIDRGCPQIVPTDVTDAGTTHAEAISCAEDGDLISGFPDGTYRPDEPLTRGQMASVLRNFLEVATPTTLPVPNDDAFPDIGGTVHRDAIAALEEADVVAGRTDGSYDVGIDQGTTDQIYQPGAAVTRGQLASILMRAADLLAQNSYWQPREPTRSALDITFEFTGDQVLDVQGGQLVGGLGQINGVANATLVFDAHEGTLGYAVDVGNLRGPFQGATGIHLQRGAVGVNSPAILVLATGPQVEAADSRLVSGVLEGVDSADNSVEAVIDEVLADPAGYDLTIRSDEFGNGAARGQLTANVRGLLTSKRVVSAALSCVG